MGDETKTVRTPAGRVVEAPAESLEEARHFRAREATPEEVTAERERLADEEKYGGILGGAAAALESGVSGATGGLYDAAGRALFGDSFTETRRKQKEYHPVVSTLAEAGGAIVGPGKVGAALGKKVAAKAGGGLAGEVLGLGAEGAVTGAGPGVSETFISKDPVTLERLLGNVSSNALLGGATNIVAGGALRTFEKALGKSRTALDDIAKGETPVAEEGAAKAKAADDILDYHANARQDGRWLIADSDAQAKKLLSESDRQLRRIGDTPDSFRARPARASEILEREEKALTKLRDAREEGLAKLAKEDVTLADDVRLDLQTLPDGATETTLTGKTAQRYSSWADVKVRGKNPTVKVSREAAEQFAEALAGGEIQGARAQAYAALDDSIAKVQGLRSQLEEAIRPPPVASKAGFLEKAVQGTVFGATVAALPAMPLGGVVAPFIGAKAAEVATNLLFKRGGDAVAGAAARTAKAMDTLMAGSRVLQKAAPPLSSAVLSSVRFAEEEKKGPGRPKKTADVEGPRDTELASSFRAREKELRSQVEHGPDGNPRMTASARQRLGQNLIGLKHADPVLADKIETLAARRTEYLASKLPKRPDFTALPMGPDNWRPSDMEMRRFARHVAAAEDPGGVEERLANGTLSPEDADAYKSVYPERLEALKLDLLSRLPELRKQLGYAQRLSLSMLTGVPLVPALQPAILRVLQGQYQNEPNTEGGTVAPTAQPAFGSVSKEKPTPAQERAGG